MYQLVGDPTMAGVHSVALHAIVAAGLLALAPQLSWGQAGKVRTAQQLVESRCALCHGADGESSSALYPKLAGQHPEYIAKQLADFKAGRRKGTMNEMAADLTEQEMRELGTYFSTKKISAALMRDPDLAAVGRYVYHKGNVYSGVAACEGCHGAKGHGTNQLPRLAGQRPIYIEQQLKQFNTRDRTNDNAVMHSIAEKLTELETKAVAAYLSSME
jgi:cytochrome c553